MIKVIEDVAAPATVVAADILTMEMAPQANEWVSYGLTALGYVSGLFDLGGRGTAMSNYLKNLGVASMALTARNIYMRVKTMQPVSRKASSNMALRNVRANPRAASPNPGGVQRPYQIEFEGAGAHMI